MTNIRPSAHVMIILMRQERSDTGNIVPTVMSSGFQKSIKALKWDGTCGAGLAQGVLLGRVSITRTPKTGRSVNLKDT